ncbi:MAG: hypothetical protein R2909_06930 [Gemmatimonadales bacterium]
MSDVLVSTNTGAPKLEAWKYPLPGDSVIFRISRASSTCAPGGLGWCVCRCRRTPIARRCRLLGRDLRRPVVSDGSTSPSSRARDHKTAWFRVADAKTGSSCSTPFEE